MRDPMPQGDELRDHMVSVHHVTRGVEQPLRMRDGQVRVYNDAELAEKHSTSHASMAISTPERMQEGQHHRPTTGASTDSLSGASDHPHRPA